MKIAYQVMEVCGTTLKVAYADYTEEECEIWIDEQRQASQKTYTIIKVYTTGEPLKNPKVEIKALETSNGVWKVLLKGDEICIVDPQDRCRHESKTHASTAIHLAMQLDKQRFVSEPNLDEALKMQVQEFLKPS